ncbi:uncharacterized protein si:dkeyp-51f12.3 [Astyanax mexicanus]|uniref:Uncharacterized protein n=1 Tax=Astyanax mexicanus TaxID=7994 RepID=A0A8T2MHM1_ASTMX|nr:uncharacterized protein si:dkeyp-51f12.3 [Astyanax mexicanus]KAG9282684.1 hypothetical protein AMEX_G1375 [Astyanax mexicanus]
MSVLQKGLVSLGVLVLAAGVCITAYAGIVGLAVCSLGLVILISSFCNVMKSNSHLTIPGHFLLHPRTGTRYTYEQAVALQRRLDRIRRASAEERRSIQHCPTTPSLHSLPDTPPPWDMEPPPPYETVMKTTTPLNQL